MIDCKKLIHPFQADPGTSQRNRIASELLNSKAKIDNRSLADLLDFFVQLSRHIQFYDETLKVSDWQSFFSRSLPFSLASITRYNRPVAEDKLAAFRKRFLKKPGRAGLYLLLRFIYTSIIKKINRWFLAISGNGTLLEGLMEKMMRDKLGAALKSFIQYANAASNKFGTKPIDFTELLANPAWALDSSDLLKEDTSYLSSGNTYYKRLIGLYQRVFDLVLVFHDGIKLFSAAAEQELEKSLLPLKEELREKHSPHLAILFAFIKLFGYLQDDLNSLTKKHLDYFYKEVLRLTPKKAVPDQVHLVLDIQKQLEKYLVKKGIRFKDGKDNNKADIYFATDDDIVVNKTKIAAQRTLFLQQQPVRLNPLRQDCTTLSVVEGVFMAQDSSMADGIDKPFGEGLPSRKTLGDQWSKYTDPENKFVYPYPTARIGFVMASPVLFLQEGTRTIRISVACRVMNNYCETLKPLAPTANPCCDDEPSVLRSFINPATAPLTATDNCLPELPSKILVSQVESVLADTYYYINRAILAALVKKGIGKELKQKLENLLLIRHKRPGKANASAGETEDPAICYCGRDEYIFELTLTSGEFTNTFNATEIEIMKDLVYPRKAMNVQFSGEKGWVKPDAANLNISIKNYVPGTGNFVLEILSVLSPGQDKITFYQADVLKEDLQTELPVVKVELDDKIKMEMPADLCRERKPGCCERAFKQKTQKVSLYHFFRDVKAFSGTKIDVQVCGLKNIIVQNDESLQNVNAPIYPFGTRPEVVDFDIKKPSPPLNALGNLNLIGPNFYLGSKEILLKPWGKISISMEWKDLPTDFRDYYKGYLKQGGQFGLDKNRFLVNISVLEEGAWKHELNHTAPATTSVTIKGIPYNDRRLFDNNNSSAYTICTSDNDKQYVFLKKEFFPLNQQFRIGKDEIQRFDVSTRNGFIRINLQVQDFCHKEYSYVLARQMMALGKLPDGKIEDAIYYDALNGNLVVFSTDTIKQDITNAFALSDNVRGDINGPNMIAARSGGSGPINTTNANAIRTILRDAILGGGNLKIDVNDLKTTIGNIQTTIGSSNNFQAVIPSEPWTPILKSLSLDYTATATSKDIDLIHLYPYEGTFKREELEQNAMLFPSFCDEGNFYIGLEGLVPGSSLDILFQFAEATADSESEREKPVWYYLENNTWKLLREGFEVLHDATQGMTTSGIIQFSMPGNISKGNTILPPTLHWIRVSVPCHTSSVCELIGIHTQAVKATFTNEEANDKLRLDDPLPAGAVTKLQVPDTAVSKIEQPYESFGGRMPEEDGHFYVRVSELLRHKNRGIQKFDYERLVLETFPNIYKTKCINHTNGLDAGKYVNDFTIAPGYVLVAVIPDMNKLKAAGSFEPKVPVSILEAVEKTMKTIISPFVRLKVMNPRYERVNLCIRVKLLPDKDKVYYKEQLQSELRTFLAPWAIGEYEKLSFGQPVYRSDIIRFLETRDYIDYIIELHMVHEESGVATLSVSGNTESVMPITARSILLAGAVDVCIDDPGCESWCKCREDCCDHQPVPIREKEKVIIN